jgi:glycerophosphoryl diester phosphodiesterase
MVKIIAHRGWWLNSAEKNSPQAFQRAVDHSFGIETDVRDFGSKLVISHDMPRGGEMTFEAFCEFWAKHTDRQATSSCQLALNIKADGLQAEILKTVEQFGINNIFNFDMAVPDMLGYFKSGLKVFTRVSELEPFPGALADQSQGVWLDQFNSDWIDLAHVERHLALGRSVCIVSPELHRRPQQAQWTKLKDLKSRDAAWVALCTDFPQEAQELFNGTN